MSQPTMFTNDNQFRLWASGSTRLCGEVRSFTTTCDNGVICVVGANGFRVSIRVEDAMGSVDDGRAEIPRSLVDCVLADGTALACEGSMYPGQGTLRIDAVDQRSFFWFWLTVDSYGARSAALS